MREGLGVSFLAHLEGTPTGRHTGYSPVLAALWRTGRIKIVEAIINAGRLGNVFFGAPGRYAYWAPYGVFSSTCAALAYRGA